MATEGQSQGRRAGAADGVATALEQIAEYEREAGPTPLTKVARVIGRTRAFALVYRTLMPTLDVRMARSTDGWVSAHVFGLPFLILTTTGAKTGQPRTNPLIYRRDGDDFLVAGTNWGQPKHPGWTANLLAHPEATIEVGPARLGVRAALVPVEEFDQLFARFVDVYPGYANYLVRRGTLTPRMFRLTPTG
jgi:deazaflavin-dependent oxidoreductase (nitroreductase family)